MAADNEPPVRVAVRVRPMLPGHDDDFGELRLYGPDAVNGTVYATGHYPICDLRVTRDGEHVIGSDRYCQDSRYIKVWNIEKKRLETVLDIESHIERFTVTPDSERIISADRLNDVAVWRLDGTHERTFQGLLKAPSGSHSTGSYTNPNRVTDLEALPDNKHAMSSSVDGIIKIFGLHDGTVLRTISRPGPVWEIKLLHDGRRFLFVQGDFEPGGRQICIAEHGMNV